MTRRRPAAWMAALVLLALAATARAQTANDLDLQARTRYAAGDYQQALEIYASLYARTLHPTYLRNIGRCHQNMGQADKAIASFKEYLRKVPDLDAKQRAEIDRYIAEMEDLKRKQAAQPTEAPRPAPRLDAVPPPAETATTPAVRRARASDRAEEPPVYTHWWFWTAIGVVVAGGAAAAVYSLTGPTTPSAATTFGTMPVNPPP